MTQSILAKAAELASHTPEICLHWAWLLGGGLFALFLGIAVGASNNQNRG